MRTNLQFGYAGMAVLVLALYASGCGALKGPPFDQTLSGREFHLCCNMDFNQDREASDSNYREYIVEPHVYSQGPRLQAGTKVRVTLVGWSALAFQPENSDQIYRLYFSYGVKQLTPFRYFDNILRKTNPMDAVRNAPPPILTAISEGKLVNGMTKDEALIARGYPPAHPTPNLESSNEWIYYNTPGFVDRVTFRRWQDRLSGPWSGAGLISMRAGHAHAVTRPERSRRSRRDRRVADHAVAAQILP